MKIYDKRKQKYDVTKLLLFNKFGNAKKLFDTLKTEKDVF